MRNASGAAEAFGEAVRLKPDYAQAHYELALAYLSQGDKEAALEEYTTLTTLNPKLAERLYELLNKYPGRPPSPWLSVSPLTTHEGTSTL